MRYEARFTAYDVMDAVQVAIVVYCAEDHDPTVVRKAFSWGRQYASRGEPDPTRWVLQLLQQAVRDLETAEKRRGILDAAPVVPHTVSDVADRRKTENA